MKRETIKTSIARFVPDVLLIAGGLMIAGGVYMIYPPAGFITFGMMLLITGSKVA